MIINDILCIRRYTSKRDCTDASIIALYLTEGQSFGRDNDGGLSGDIGGYFSNAPNNNIGDTFKESNDNASVGGNRQNGGNGGYQY